MDKKSFLNLGGLQKRWLLNTASVVFALGLVCVLAVTAYFAARYYSDMEMDLHNRGEDTKEIFADHAGQSYDEYYKSCVSFAQNFGDDEHLQLQFVAAAGDFVASSRGQWTGEVPNTSEIENAISTRGQSYFVGRDPAMNERIMALAVPIIYSNGEVIGVLRYVTSVRKLDSQIIQVALTSCAVLLAVLLAYQLRFWTVQLLLMVLVSCGLLVNGKAMMYMFKLLDSMANHTNVTKFGSM